MLSMMKKGVRGEICHAIHRNVKTSNKYIKNYDKDKKLSYLQYWDINNLYRWVISQKLPLNGFKCVEETYQFMKIS